MWILPVPDNKCVNWANWFLSVDVRGPSGHMQYQGRGVFLIKPDKKTEPKTVSICPTRRSCHLFCFSCRLNSIFVVLLVLVILVFFVSFVVLIIPFLVFNIVLVFCVVPVCFVILVFLSFLSLVVGLYSLFFLSSLSPFMFSLSFLSVLSFLSSLSSLSSLFLRWPCCSCFFYCNFKNRKMIIVNCETVMD